MEAKKHFKLYKSGKLWVTAAVTTVALTTGMAMHTNTASTTPPSPSTSLTRLRAMTHPLTVQLIAQPTALLIQALILQLLKPKNKLPL